MDETLRFIKQDTPTWKVMWAAIERRFGSVECQCPDTGEVWQYMGTVIKSAGIVPRDEAFVEHQFRHRSFKGKRKYFSVHTPYGRCKADFIEPPKK